MFRNPVSRNFALTLVASVGVIALLAVAGRECFDGHCSLPGLAEHPTAVAPATVAQVPPQSEEKHAADTVERTHEASVAPPSAPVAPPLAEAVASSKVAAVDTAPAVNAKLQHDAEPVVAAVPAVLRPQERTSSIGEARIIRVALASPRDAGEAQPIDAANIVPQEESLPTRVAAIGPVDEIVDSIEGRRPLARVMVARGVAPLYAGYPGGGVVLTSVALDPAWRLCQIRGLGWQNASLCGPYSYHPYGVYGYRPYGTYASTNVGTRIGSVTPDAKIIQIQPRR